MDFWDRRAARYHTAPRETRFQNAIDRAAALFGPDDVVLDVGCGSGPACRELAPHVRAVHGIDTSAEMIRLAREEAPDGCTFEQTDVHDAALEEYGFTAAVAFNILHLVDAPATLERIAELLPPGGLLLTQTPCLGEESAFKRGLIRVATMLWRLRGLRSLRQEELRGWMERDFDVVEAHAEDGVQAVWMVGRKR